MKYFRNSYRGQAGVTLIEILIVVVIVSIISAVAYPSYVQHITKTRRTTAQSALLQVADRQQQFFMDNKRYETSLANLGFVDNPLWLDDKGDRVPPGDTDSVYAMVLVNVQPTSFMAVAVPIGIQRTRDAECGVMTLDQAGVRQTFPLDGTAEDDCW
ncbi:MAG TPA: type IV pilin protein [Woeseiaceae bacterium]|jgi:type IV pilus assembly protein PilE|nr:type IV pilin protein [Woeseiaceae bacterium]